MGLTRVVYTVYAYDRAAEEDNEGQTASEEARVSHVRVAVLITGIQSSTQTWIQPSFSPQAAAVSMSVIAAT